MPNYASELAMAMIQDFIPRAEDNFYKETPGLNMVMGMRQPVRSNSFRVPIAYQGLSNFTAYRGEQTIPTTIRRQLDAVDYTLAQFVNTSYLPEDEADYSRASGEHAVVDLLRTKSELLVKDLALNLSSEFYGTADAAIDKWLGLRRVISTTASDTVGGVSTTTLSAWAPTSVDTSTALASLTLETVEKKIGALWDVGYRPDTGLTTQTIYDKLCTLAESGTSGLIYRIQTQNAANIGVESLRIRGVTFMPDPYAPASHLFIFPKDQLKMKYFPLHNWRKQSWPVEKDQWVVGVSIDVWAQTCVAARRAFTGFTALS
jgi:hypothetical protein